MSKKTSRENIRIDYKIFHQTGKKVAKESARLEKVIEKLENDSIMTANRLVDEEKKIGLEISGFWDEYNLEDLYGADDVNDSISELKGLKIRFENIHVELQRELADEWAQTYPNYHTNVKRITDWIKGARKEISMRKRDVETAAVDRQRADVVKKAENKLDEEAIERAEKNNAEKALLKTKEKYLLIKIEQLFTKNNFEKEDDVIEIERNLACLEGLLEKHTELHYMLEVTYGEEYADEYGDKFKQDARRMDDLIVLGQQRIKSIKQAARLTQEKREEAYANAEFESKVTLSKHILDEIEARVSIFEDVYGVDKLKTCSDDQILEKKKSGEKIDRDLSGIMERITELVKETPRRYDEEEKIIEKASKIRSWLCNTKGKFLKELENQIAERDLSARKLHKTSLLNIKIPKFKGYDSVIDIYTFQSEFEKLIAPDVQKRLQPDYLKKNYLDEPALSLVREIHNIDEIWTQLKASFGCAMLLLQNKLSEVRKMGPLYKINKDKEKLILTISKLVNNMTDLKVLAAKHSISDQLFHHSYLSMVLDLLGNQRKEKFFYKNIGTTMSCEEEWNKLIEFLKEELKVAEKMVLDKKSHQYEAKNANEDKICNAKTSYQAKSDIGSIPLCIICGKDDHVVTTTKSGRNLVHYFSCEKFVKMKPLERFEELKKRNLCFQCLYPGSHKNHDGACFNQFACKHESHKMYSKGKHILVCEEHKDDPKNKELFEKYKNKFITKSNVEYKGFTKNMKLSYFAGAYIGKVDEEINERSIFMLQTIRVGNKDFNLFFDSGCGDLVSGRDAVRQLEEMGRASNVVPGPIILTGVGDNKIVCPHGIYKVRLTLHDGKDINVSGICLDKPTAEFPEYQLSEVSKDIQKEYRTRGMDPKTLPKLSASVGGGTDFMLGNKYFKYYPKEIFRLPSGLTIFESAFASSDGSRGVIGGPHRVFTEVEKQLNGSHLSIQSYCSQILQIYKDGYKVSLDVPLLSSKTFDDVLFDECVLIEKDEPVFQNQRADPKIKIKNARTDVKYRYAGTDVKIKRKNTRTDVKYRYAGTDVKYRSVKCRDCPEIEDEMFDDCCSVDAESVEADSLVFQNQRTNLRMERKFAEIENAGTDVSYRCVKCRDCQSCKTNDKVEKISIQEEIEQHLIDRSVKVDIQKCETVANLPFIHDPTTRLSPNQHIAMKVYKSQINKLQQYPEDKRDVIESEKKLQQLGFVDYFDNLPDDLKSMVMNSPIKHFIPWRAVWNLNSLSTLCRLVFDASMKTNGMYSLNDLLAKGSNNMNRLVEVVIRWMIHGCAYHTDIQKMYNTIKLNPSHWCYQLYLWDDELNPKNVPKWKVIKTLIYGVKPSGNQAERGLRQTAILQAEKYPRVNDVIQNDIYVDDCLSGETTEEKAKEKTDNVKLVLEGGGFTLKGITFSGSDPPPSLTDDGESVNVAGQRWFSKEDKISLNITELNFGKKSRGKKPYKLKGMMPLEFTKRDCVGKVAEVFDLLGKVTPITAGMKLDLRELTRRKLDWDDTIPNDLKEIWINNFEMMKELGQVRFRRAIVPKDAVNLEIETIDTADASQSLICVAIYARFKRKNGEYSCQLVFSRSKIVPENTTMPRAELSAAVLNAHTGHIVQKSFGDKFKKCLKLTDSQIALHWVTNETLRLFPWVKNRVIEITRLTSREWWKFVTSEDMIADLGTRKGAKVVDISEDSFWFNGYPWMKLQEKDFPVKAVQDLILCNEEKMQHDKECLDMKVDPGWDWGLYPAVLENNTHIPSISTELAERYRFANYILDPNKFRLRKVIRIVAIVMVFIGKLKKKVGRRLNISSSCSIPSSFKFLNDQYLVTEGKSSLMDSKFKCKDGMVVSLTDADVQRALTYYYRKATEEVKKFVDRKTYQNISQEKDGILYYTARILPSQEFNGKLNLCDASLDLISSSFCVPLTDSKSPFAYSVTNEVHWYSSNAQHSGVETVLRHVNMIAFVIGGRSLVKKIRKQCIKCRILAKKAVEVAMGPIHQSNLNIAPPFFMCQVDIFGPVSTYSNVNKRATVKLWFVVFCCCSTGAVDVKTMEDCSTESFILGFIRFSCKFGYPKILMPDEGSQLMKGCQVMNLEFYNIKHKLHKEFGVEFETCPAGAHYMHGKCERKIKHVQESFMKATDKKRLSIIQWETLADQVANSINNMPIAIGNIVEDVESLDILTPNRLILGRNNERSPTGNLTVTSDPRKIIQSNNEIFETWFECWLTSYVPTLTYQPKWFRSDRDVKIGDVILFLKSDKEFQKIYQYGLIKDVKIGKDNKIRKIDIEYQNANEKVKRVTNRGTRDIVVIHPVDELGISFELNAIAKSEGYCNCYYDFL